MRLGDILVITLVLLVLLTIGTIFFLPSLFTTELTSKELGKAPELQGIDGYINTEKIELAPHIGKKVILVDFWTYTCINCIRTLPYLKMWDEKYRDDGLLIIGVHAPEFDFEKNYSNVVRAVTENGLKYPIVLDNEHTTWSAYENRYWPAKYLIDKHGTIVYTHFGEGNYEETERKIQELLKDLSSKTVNETIGGATAENTTFEEIGTPELYFGYTFKHAKFGNEPANLEANKEYTFTLPEEIGANTIYLEGTWKNNPDDLELVSDTGTILLVYKAKNVNIVAGSSTKSTVSVEVEGAQTRDVSVKEFTLYRVVEGTGYQAHLVKLNIRGKGFRINTFTFG